MIAYLCTSTNIRYVFFFAYHLLLGCVIVAYVILLLVHLICVLSVLLNICCTIISCASCYSVLCWTIMLDHCVGAVCFYLLCCCIILFAIPFALLVAFLMGYVIVCSVLLLLCWTIVLEPCVSEILCVCCDLICVVYFLLRHVKLSVALVVIWKAVKRGAAPLKLSCIGPLGPKAPAQYHMVSDY